MKKYISILNLASVLFMFSCERDVSDSNNSQEKVQSTKLQSQKYQPKIKTVLLRK